MSVGAGRRRCQPRREDVELQERGEVAVRLRVDYPFHSAIADRVTKNP